MINWDKTSIWNVKLGKTKQQILIGNISVMAANVIHSICQFCQFNTFLITSMTSHLSKLQISFDLLIPMVFFYAFMARTRLDIPNQIRIKSLQQTKAFIARISFMAQINQQHCPHAHSLPISRS